MNDFNPPDDDSSSLDSIFLLIEQMRLIQFTFMVKCTYCYERRIDSNYYCWSLCFPQRRVAIWLSRRYVQFHNLVIYIHLTVSIGKILCKLSVQRLPAVHFGTNRNFLERMYNTVMTIEFITNRPRSLN